MEEGTNEKFDILFAPELYERFSLHSLDLTQRQVRFLTEKLSLPSGGKVLDLACGYGRHAVALSEMGYEVTGVDESVDLLQRAGDHAKDKGQAVTFVGNDMRHIDYSHEFDAVIVMNNSFGFFDDDTNRDVLRRIAASAKPGGTVCLDVMNRDTQLKLCDPYYVYEQGEDLCIDRCSFDPDSGRFTNRRIFIVDGKRIDAPYFIRLYSPTEIRQLASECGLRVEGFYGDFQGGPLSTDRGKMLVIAKKH